MNSTKFYSDKLLSTFEIEKIDAFSQLLNNFQQVKNILNLTINDKMKL